MEQAFTVPFGVTSIIASFDMFMNSLLVGSVVHPAGLDHTVRFTTGEHNQHARVDILTLDADAFSTDAIDIVSNLVPPGADSGPNPNPYTSYSFDVTDLLAPGETYKLRFGEVDNWNHFNAGVDNVSILASTPMRVTEPPNLALFGFAIASLGLIKLQLKRKNMRTADL